MKNNFKYITLITLVFIYTSNCIALENKSEENRKKSTIKLSCKIKKANIIKKYDGTSVNIWFNSEELSKFDPSIRKPIILETNPNSLALWIDGKGVLGDYNNKDGIGYLNEMDSKGKNLVTLHFATINYNNLNLKAENSIPIKKDQSRFNYNFNNKPTISSITYGKCSKIKI
jgi:hypothetical protein